MTHPGFLLLETTFHCTLTALFCAMTKQPNEKTLDSLKASDSSHFVITVFRIYTML